MQGFPFNLILAVATASATIFLGFLPTKTIRSSFFGMEALKAALMWGAVALVVPAQVIHYYLFFALLCGGAWWQFRNDLALRGKMWFSVASGLGISLGGMLILATTSAYLPVSPLTFRHLELNQMNSIDQAVLIISIYLGGAVIGLAYVTYILTRQASTKSGVTNGLAQRHAELLLILVLARATAAAIAFYLLRPDRSAPGAMEKSPIDPHTLILMEAAAALGLLLVVLPALAFYVKRASQLSSRVQPTRALMAMMILGFVAEVLARLLVF